MITKLKFVDDHLCFTKGQEFEFKPITLLVGDQGCGKSTMLGIIKNGNAPVSVARTGPSQDKVLALDMEKDNPRTSPADVNNAASYKMSLVSHFQSHGEVLLPIIKFIDGVEPLEGEEQLLGLAGRSERDGQEPRSSRRPS